MATAKKYGTPAEPTFTRSALAPGLLGAIGLMAGLDQPSSGEILIDGTDITKLGEDALARLRGRAIGFVF